MTSLSLLAGRTVVETDTHHVRYSVGKAQMRHNISRLFNVITGLEYKNLSLV